MNLGIVKLSKDLPVPLYLLPDKINIIIVYSQKSTEYRWSYRRDWAVPYL